MSGRRPSTTWSQGARQRPRLRHDKQAGGAVPRRTDRIDLTTGDVSVARLARVMQHHPMRTAIIALQEVRPPRETTRCSMHGCTIMYSDLENKQAGVALAMRHDVMTKHNVTRSAPRGRRSSTSRSRSQGRRATGIQYFPPALLASVDRAVRELRRGPTVTSQATCFQNPPRVEDFGAHGTASGALALMLVCGGSQGRLDVGTMYHRGCRPMALGVDLAILLSAT